MATFFTCVRKTFVFLLVLVFLSACASKSKDIESAEVSPLAYQSYDCEQIGQEMLKVGLNLSAVSSRQDSTATKDAVAMGAGIIFWPSFFFLASGDDSKEEIARLKGESEALEQSAISKQCSTILAQRDETIKLIEEKLQECIDNGGGSRCNREDIVVEVAKERNASIASLSEDENPPNGFFVIYEDKYTDFNYDAFNFKNINITVDVSFEYDYFVDGSLNHKVAFTKSIIENLKKSGLFNEISIVEPNVNNNEFKITFYADRINSPIIRDFAMLPITVLTFNNYDHWQEHRFVIETKIYKNSKFIKGYDNKKNDHTGYD